MRRCEEDTCSQKKILINHLSECIESDCEIHFTMETRNLIVPARIRGAFVFRLRMTLVTAVRNKNEEKCAVVLQVRHHLLRRSPFNKDFELVGGSRKEVFEE